jgi:CheY-like chemotaxis protein
MTTTPSPPDHGEQSLASHCVRALMDRNGVPRHKHSTVAAEVLGISYSQAHRKVQRDSPWSLEELKHFAEHYGTTLAELVGLADADTSQPAVLLAGAVRVPCRLWVGDVMNVPRAGALVAMRVSSEWVVLASSDEVPPPTYAIRRLLVQASEPVPRRIAVLDDTHDQTDSLCAYLRDIGFEAVPFYSAEGLAIEFKTQPFDGYLIDWLVGNKSTRPLIASIRSADPKCPIGVLTGEVQTGRAEEGEVADAVKSYKLMFFEKPLRLPIISAQLTQAFGAQ